MTSELSRRRFLGTLGIGAAAASAGAFGISAATNTSAPVRSARGIVPFDGDYQAGIVTPAQDRLHFVAFDVLTDDRTAVIAMLRSWTDAARSMTAGRAVGAGGAVNGSPAAAPDDSGEALGLHPANLTLTIGFGPTLFRDATGKDRFGIANKRPFAFVELPAFPGDNLDPLRSNGDIAIQACSDDPQVAVHAIRNLVRLARGVAEVRYSQLGFGRTSSTSTTQATPRNLMGFKDGTANLKLENKSAIDQHVWATASDGADWMHNGTYLVTRRIRMLIEPWDSTPLSEQQRIIGRTKGEGAPLGKAKEFETLDFDAKDDKGEPEIDMTSHVRLAHSSTNGGSVLLRRGYSFVDGTDGLGRLDAGLFFIAYQRDPRNQFVRINTSLAGKHNDALNEYIQHVGSGVFACPPGVSPRQYWGETLFA